MKTYSRARTAKAAAIKATEGLSIFISGIEAFETEDAGRFSAEVRIKSGAGKEVEDQIIGLGFKIAVEVAPPKPAVTKKTSTGKARQVSTVEGPCAMVWAIADDVVADGGKRKDILEACAEAGIAKGTARTQYDKWRVNRKKGLTRD